MSLSLTPSEAKLLLDTALPFCREVGAGEREGERDAARPALAFRCCCVEGVFGAMMALWKGRLLVSAERSSGSSHELARTTRQPTCGGQEKKTAASERIDRRRVEGDEQVECTRWMMKFVRQKVGDADVVQ